MSVREGAAAYEIERAELVRIIAAASDGCVESTRAKLLAVAETTDAFAAGWFHCDGVRCPARQAGRRNQHFQETFDRAIAEHFGVELGGDGLPVPAIVVAVRP